jgi:hypothetical protein
VGRRARAAGETQHRIGGRSTRNQDTTAQNAHTIKLERTRFRNQEALCRSIPSLGEFTEIVNAGRLPGFWESWRPNAPVRPCGRWNQPRRGRATDAGSRQVNTARDNGASRNIRVFVEFSTSP